MPCDTVAKEEHSILQEPEFEDILDTLFCLGKYTSDGCCPQNKLLWSRYEKMTVAV